MKTLKEILLSITSVMWIALTIAIVITCGIIMPVSLVVRMWPLVSACGATIVIVFASVVIIEAVLELYCILKECVRINFNLFQ